MRGNIVTVEKIANTCPYKNAGKFLRGVGDFFQKVPHKKQKTRGFFKPLVFIIISQ